MNDCRMDFDLKGIHVMVKALDKVGKSPQKAVTKAASKAITPLLREIRRLAPRGDTRSLKKAITRKAEKSRAKGKKVYEVTFSAAYNTVLRKEIKRPGIYGGKSRQGYYPASQEYGFLTRKKGGQGFEYRYGRQFRNYNSDLADYLEKYRDDPTRSLKQTHAGRHRNSYVETVQGVESRKVEGQRYMLKGAEKASPEATKIMTETLEKELDKLWKEAQHG